MSFRGPGNIMRTQPTNRYASEPAQPVLAKFGVDGKLLSEFLPDGLDGGDSTSLFAITSAQDATGTIDGSPVLTVDGGTGNVGVGTAPAANIKLHVKGDAGALAYMQVEGATGQSSLVLLRPGDASKDWFLQAANSSGDFLLQNDSSSPIIRARQTGEVGIAVQPTLGNRFQVGTTATSTALTVEDSTGIVRVGHDTTGALRIGAGDDLRLYHDGSDSYIYNFTGSFVFGTATATDILFTTNSSICGRFDHDRNQAFVVGAAIAQSGAKLDIQTTGQAHALYVADGDGTLHSPWNGTSGSPNISIGSADQSRHYFDGTNAYWRTSSGVQALIQAGPVIGFRVHESGYVELANTASAPTGSAGRIYYNSTDNHFYGHNGTSWVQLDN